MTQTQTTVQIRPDSSTQPSERTAILYGWLRRDILIGRSRQLYRTPAFEALELARRYAALMAIEEMA